MTKKIIRYGISPGFGYREGELEIVEAPDGEWVKYQDIEHLLHPEPQAEPIANLISHIDKTGFVYSYEPIFEKAKAALSPPPEQQQEVAGKSPDPDCWCMTWGRHPWCPVHSAQNRR